MRGFFLPVGFSGRYSSVPCRYNLPMPALMRRLNYRHIILGRDTENETVAVRTRDGDYRYLPWLGFVDLDRALSIAGARPVKLQVMSVTAGDGVGDWIRLRNGEHVQGWAGLSVGRRPTIAR